MHDFLTGPAMAGLFAVGAAFIAYSAARVSNKTAKEHAEEEEWWARAEWGIGLAVSENIDQKVVGLAAIEVLIEDATGREDALVRSVAEHILRQNTVDIEGSDSENSIEDGDSNEEAKQQEG